MVHREGKLVIVKIEMVCVIMYIYILIWFDYPLSVDHPQIVLWKYEVREGLNLGYNQELGPIDFLCPHLTSHTHHCLFVWTISLYLLTEHCWYVLTPLFSIISGIWWKVSFIHVLPKRFIYILLDVGDPLFWEPLVVVFYSLHKIAPCRSY